MSSPPIDSRLGRVEIAFPDPGAFGAVALLLGGVLSVTGLGLTLLSALTPSRGSAAADVIGGSVLAAACALGGLVLAILAIRDLRRKPVWQLCRHGVVCTGNGWTGRPIMWTDVRNLKIVLAKRVATTTGFHLRGDGLRMRVPSLEVAKRGHDLWQGATAGRPNRPA